MGSSRRNVSGNWDLIVAVVQLFFLFDLIVCDGRNCVSFVEPMASAAGKFRVWITEDPQDEGIHMVTNNNLHFDYDGWPDDNYVRLGSRAKGWVLLDEVPLGYEVWRQLNNFPPEYPEESKTNTSAGDEAKK